MRPSWANAIHNAAMISIVVPVYNVEGCLRQCVDSILGQTYPDWQLILVDDGSTDRSGLLCDGYAGRDSRISVLHQPNAGVSAARNAGMDAAGGELLCFVDADDWLEPDFLRDFRADSPAADFYLAGWRFDVGGRAFSAVRYREALCRSAAEVRAEFLRQNLRANGYPWGKLYKLSIIRRHGLRFNERLSLNEDHVFVLHYFSLIDTLSVRPAAGYHYRVFAPSGRKKLSSLRHSYAEYMEISAAFSRSLSLLNERWALPADCYQELRRTFVYGNRLHATECACREGRKAFAREAGFWRGQRERLTTRYENLLLAVVRSRLPLLVRRGALMLILWLRALWRMRRSSERRVYDYLLSASEGPQQPEG